MKYNLFCAQVYQNEDGKREKKLWKWGIYSFTKKKKKGKKKHSKSYIQRINIPWNNPHESSNITQSIEPLVTCWNLGDYKRTCSNTWAVVFQLSLMFLWHLLIHRFFPSVSLRTCPLIFLFQGNILYHTSFS